MNDVKHISIEEYDYPLPEDRIAKYPLPERDADLNPRRTIVGD